MRVRFSDMKMPDALPVRNSGIRNCIRKLTAGRKHSIIHTEKQHMKKSILKMIVCLTVCFAVLAQVSVPLCLAEGTLTGENVIVDPVGKSDSYSAVVYNNTNGLPTSEANAIEQTADGFIWIGGYSGLIRYDGCYFERMDSTNGIASVVSLYADQEDRLWIGTNDSGLAVMENETFRMFTEPESLRHTKFCAITGDDNGLIYAGTPTGLAVIDSDMNLTIMDEPELKDLYVDVLTKGHDGYVYGVSNKDDLFIVKDGKLVSYLKQEDNAIYGPVSIISDPDRPGYVYVANDDCSLYYGNFLEGFPELETIDISPLTEVLDMKKFGSQLYIAGRNGIGLLQNGEFHMLSDLPMNNSVSHIMADYEGNLWFCSTRQGVMKVVPNRFQNLFERYGLDAAVVNSTCRYDGMLMVGTDTGLIVLDENGPVSSLPLTKAVSSFGEDIGETDLIEMMDGCRIRSIIRDSKGRLWFSTWRGCGLVCYDNGEVIHFGESDGLLTDRLRAIAETEDGLIAAAVSGGVSLIKEDKVLVSYGQEDGIVNTETLSVEAAPNGDILVGSNGGGIYVVNQSGIDCIDTEDGLTSGIVMRIKYDSRNQVFWIVTSNSLAYMDEDYHVTTIQNFPYSNNYDIYFSSENEAWILSSNGIYVTDAEDLLANGEISPVHYSLANGIRCTATGNSYSELTEDGDLYISGSAGVVKVNINEPMENVMDLKVSVPYVDADDTRLYPDESGTFHLSSEVHKLIVYIYVFNYSLTDPKVTYNLSGFEKKSVTVNRSDLTPITYTGLPGGSYDLVVSVSDSLGHSDKVITVPLVKQKTIFEQGWFYVLLALLIAAAVAEGVRIYIRRKTKLMEKKQAEMIEKELLNTELHTASRIQTSMMPQNFPPFPERREFDIYASMTPARDVGGDFYDFYMIDEDHLCLVIADVSGKGIPGALFMMISEVILKNSAKMLDSPAEVLDMANDVISSNNRVSMFVTIWLGILEISTGIVKAANAGHEYPAIMKDGRFEIMKDKHNLAVGVIEGMKYKEYEFTMKPGDKLFVYTDGIPEAINPAEEMFGLDRLTNALNRQPDAEPKQILANVQKAVDDFAQSKVPFDDVTMLCIEYKGCEKES